MRLRALKLSAILWTLWAKLVFFMCIEVRRFTWDFIDSNMYVIKNGGKALVIDPIDSNEAFEFLKNCDSITVLLTHEHYDHISGLNRIRSEHSCIVIAQEQCSLRIQDKKKNLSAFANILMEISDTIPDKTIIPFVCKSAEITFLDSYVFDWEGIQILMVATPGHSPGSICILIENLLFSGDSLLARGAMNRFPGGNDKVYHEKTLPLLKELLTKANIVYPGHGTSEQPDGFMAIRSN